MSALIFYTRKEVCGILKISINTLMAAIDRGEIEAKKIGRQWRISEKALNKLSEKSDVPTGIAHQSRARKSKKSGIITLREYAKSIGRI
jgi:DNA binding domain, excisionase family